MKLRLQWKMFLAVAALLVSLLAAVNLGLTLFLPPYLTGVIRGDLLRDAHLAADAMQPILTSSPVDLPAVDNLAHSLAAHSRLRVTVIAPDGTVIGESEKSHAELAQVENHLHRPEVQSALTEGFGVATRHSGTIDVDLLYAAVRVPGADQKSYFVRVALPLYQIHRTTRHVQLTVLVASIIVALAALPVAYLLSRRISEPLEDMRQMAVRVAQGNLNARVPTNLDGELADLAVSLNSMAEQLDQRLRELTAEKAELSATLANMTEGVLVVDAAGKIRLANQALQQQLGVTSVILGHTALEVFRNAALYELIQQALTTDQIATQELTLHAGDERTYEINAARLRGHGGECVGAVLVLHDITRLQALENIRREFVANVSHELRTPLSIIKGYVETLLEDPRPDPATADNFLRTIQRHSGRLESLIGDLLTISALESQQARITTGAVSLRSVAEAARDELAPQAATRKTRLDIEIPTGFPAAQGDASRLHQVFVNLLDNAIKYTPPGSRVAIQARDAGSQLEICVADNGPGIAAEHLPRVFERFYRVDKARSRDLGGTGLGLSIVKHIIQAHGGRVWAESEPGKGSRFYFTVPRA